MTLQSLNGPASTALVTASPDGNNKRIFNVSHDSALVSGFTMRGAYNEGGYSGDLGAACLRITAGIVSNCIVQSCTGSRTGSYGPGAISVAGTGRLVDSIVRSCASTWGSSSGQNVGGGGIAIYAGGRVSRCVVSNCYATAIADETCPARGGGAYVMGGVLRASFPAGGTGRFRIGFPRNARSTKGRKCGTIEAFYGCTGVQTALVGLHGTAAWNRLWNGGLQGLRD